MSIAPAKRASMAEGPALKLVHCTFTCGPIALSKNPLALPTIAWACVMLGNAPTRMVLALPWAQPEAAVARPSARPIQILLFTLGAPDHHGEDAGGCFFLVLLALAGLGIVLVVDNQVGQSSVVENACRRITHVEEDLIKRAVRKIAIDEFAELLGVAEGGQRAVDEPNDLAEMDLGGFAAQLVAALGSAHALDHAGVLEFEQD